MKHLLLLIALNGLLLVACQDDKTSLQAAIEEVSQAMQQESYPSQENMEKIIGLYDEYLRLYPNDEKSITYMELKAKYLSANNQQVEAIAAYDELIKTFPEDPRAAEALFMQAFILENYLLDKSGAEEKYSDFLKHYPKHELADDAMFSIENLSLSEEELLQKIMQSVQDSVE